MPDYFGSYDDMVVREYLSFFAASYGIVGDQREQVIGDVLDLTDLAYKSDAEVNSLSRGMQQRLSVARVLLHDPKVLLLDEPASGLDPRARIEMRELLKELHLMGKTILISSHILLELADLCDVVGIIEQGELKFTGTMQEIIERARAMGGTNVLYVSLAGKQAQAAALLQGLPEVAKVEAHQRATQNPARPLRPVLRRSRGENRRRPDRRRLHSPTAGGRKSQFGNRLHAADQRPGAIIPIDPDI